MDFEALVQAVESWKKIGDVVSVVWSECEGLLRSARESRRRSILVAKRQ